jgi:ribose 5-phosphate isomerase A
MSTSQLSTPEERALYKQQAAERAVDFVRPGMVVGLGTGSTAIFATRRLARLLQEGQLSDIVGFATSQAVWEEARRLGIPLMTEEMPHAIDITIDGADEIDPHLNLIKGGGGALLREKIVAQASRRMIVVADDSKLSPRLGTHRVLPVEVLAFGWRSQLRHLESLGALVIVRQNSDGSRFITDSGNMILDCYFGPIADPHGLASRLRERAGIVEHGLFLDLATDLIIAGKDGVHHRRRDG